MNRVLVCGGRDGCTWTHEFLDMVHGAIPIDVLIQGGARGVDAQAAQWAIANGIAIEEYRADWARHSRGAGPIRNKQMLVEGKPTLVVAMPGGRGTANMVKQAKAAKITVMVARRNNGETIG